MLRSLKDLERYTLTATNGDLGSVSDFLLDDEQWTIRYVVVQTAGFLDDRRVLISPMSFRDVDWATHRFHVALTTDKVRSSPGIDLDKPVSRQHERAYLGYLGYPYYWGYAGVWGMGGYPGLLAKRPAKTPFAVTADGTPGDAHLQSAKAVRGYNVLGTNGAIGHVVDFIVDDATWQLRYLVVDTSIWWFGTKVLVSPAWTHDVRWEDRTVRVEMSRQAIKASPVWDAEAPVNREYEARLYDYHGRPTYWGHDDETVAPVSPM